MRPSSRDLTSIAYGSNNDLQHFFSLRAETTNLRRNLLREKKTLVAQKRAAASKAELRELKVKWANMNGRIREFKAQESALSEVRSSLLAAGVSPALLQKEVASGSLEGSSAQPSPLGDTMSQSFGSFSARIPSPQSRGGRRGSFDQTQPTGGAASPKSLFGRTTTGVSVRTSRASLSSPSSPRAGARQPLSRSQLGI
ncbi:hypothetical protein KIPB_008761, partial [Kipferlia bialata]|eukprot:g8761.t1